MRPDLSRVPEFFHGYINHVPENDLMEAFRIQSPALMNFLESIPAEKHHYRYATGKWSIQEVVQHMIDAERVFIYRALCFARGERASLPAFDENAYADNSRADKRNWNDLVEEFRAVRKSAGYFFSSLDEEQLDAGGLSNNHPNYVLAMGYILIGHAMHHTKVMRERYL